MKDNSQQTADIGFNFNEFELYQGHEELKDVNLYYAHQELKISGVEDQENIEKLYKASGSKLILEEILSKLGENAVKALFFENSTLASTLKDSTLSAYTCVWEKNSKGYSIQNSISDNFVPIIKKLQNSFDIVFGHPDFFIKPAVGKSLITFAPEDLHNAKTLIKSYKKIDGEEQLKWLHDNYKISKSNKEDIVLEVQKLLEFEEADNGNIYIRNSSIKDTNYDNVIKNGEKVQSYNDGNGIEFEKSPLLLHLLNHRIYHDEFIDDRESIEQKTIFISIPILGARSDKSTTDKDGKELKFMQGQGAIFIYLVLEEKTKIDTNLLYKLIELQHSLPALIKDITFYYLFKIGKELFDLAASNAIKSAKAAIMSRNMSHNLGSHVLSYLKESLKHVDNILDSKLLSNIGEVLSKPQYTGSEDIHTFLKGNGNNNLKLPFLVGLGNLISYLQERQDFIATIATDYIPSMSTINFKDFVFDVINSDLKHIRHDKSNSHISKNILLDNIARSEGYRRENIQICYKSYNGLNEIDEDILKTIKRNFNNEPKNYYNSSILSKWVDDYPNNKESHKNNIENLREKEIDLPGGLLGRQALFSIFENLIRNTTKHNPKNINPFLKLTVVIEAFYYEDSMNRVNDKIRFDWSKHPQKGNNEYIDSFQKKYPENEYYVFSITDNMKNGNNVVSGKSVAQLLNENLSESLINNTDSSQNENYKGMKELKISAQWIIGEEYIEELIPIWFSVDDYSNLRLNFFVKKPKTLAIISNNIEKKDIKFEIENDDSFNHYSLEAFKRLDLEVFNHSVIVTDCTISDLGISNYSEINARTFHLDCGTITSCLNKCYNNLDAYLEFYKIYIKEVRRFNFSQLVITDTKVNDKENELRDFKDKLSINTKGFVKGNILFRDHLDSEEQFYETFEGAKEDKNKPIFLESITGHNSSNRWIRNTKWDDLWYLNNIESAQTSVVIIDERIHDAKVNEKYKSIMNHLYYCKYDKEYAEIDANLLRTIDEDYFDELNGKDFLCKDVSIDEVILFSKGFFLNKIEVMKDAILNEWKNISILDIDFNIKDEKDGIKRYPVFDLFFDLIGWFSEDVDGEVKFEIENQDYKYKKPHFLFIHQGLIDKLPKKQINFAHLTPSVLPITHSGRSKPSNLSEGHAFVPYSLLSQLVEETKLALTDLCYTSKVEQTIQNK